MIKDEIDVNAGILWDLLAEKGILSIKELEEDTEFSSLTLGMVLGWLFRENKVKFTEKNGVLYVELLESPTDIFY